MGHTISDNQLSITERDFRECMRHADDFFKIELLRQAKKCYRQALDFKLDTEMVIQRIVECDKMLAFERKVTIILAVITSVIVLASLIIWN